jgi:branched-chain amino acid transport system permease protein
LRKSFGGIRAIDRLDLTVPSGSIFAIIGPNGSGKTTLFNVVTGLDSADDGSVHLAGHNIVGLAPDAIVARGMARTFQNLRLFGNMTVLENVLVGGHIRSRTGIVGAVLGTPRARAEEADIRTRSLSIISFFGNRLMPRLDHLARSLSYANRRRLEIARAIMTRPSILLLDEPAAGMNPSETLELVEQIRALRDAGLTILLIEHKLEVVNEIADRVIVLDHGEKVVEGTPTEVYQNENVLRAYLGRTNNVRAAS